MSPDRATLLPAVVDIVRGASAAILEVYGSADFATTTKADASPLTIADLRAHALISQALKSLTPGIPILSEEGAAIPFDERRHWLRHWLVDPLDGTKEFVRRNGEFTVNIALIENHEPILGVVGVPVSGVVYSGGPGVGAWRQRAGEPAHAIAVTKPAANPLRVIGSKSHRGDSLDALLAKLGPHEFVPVGSALKFCLVAEGTADFYPRLGPTSEWDTAAAHAVVLGAGGSVLEASGRPLRYNTKADLLNPHFLVFGDASRDWLKIAGN